MKLVKVESNGGDFKKVIASAGVHIARVFRIIDMGTHYNPTYDKSNRQVEISWELPEETHVFKAENGAQPLVVSKTFTASLHEKSALTKLLKGWGVDLTSDTFELDDLFDIPCQLTLSHNVKGDKTYVNVDGVSAVHPKLPIPAPIKEQFSLSLDSFDNEVYETLPNWMQEKIATTPEFKEIAVVDPSVAAGAESSDDLPF